MNMIISIFEQGILWSLLGVALFLTFRILHFPDLTVEGSLPLGAAVCVKLITVGVDPLTATAIAIISGGILGGITGFLYTKLEVPMLLSGILTMTAAYSINLRIMGSANIALKDNKTIFSFKFLELFPEDLRATIMALIVSIVFILIISYFLYSKLGKSFIAAGDNEVMATSIGINTDSMKIIGLILSNSIVSLVGAVVAQNNSFADIGMGAGTIVIALVSIIMVELLFKNITLFQRLLSIIFGSILYRFIIFDVLLLGLNPSDINLISSIVLVLCFVVPYYKKNLQKKKVINK